jgi:hypothetical protein
MCVLQGFGKRYWGNKWRFKVFDGFYTHPKDPESGVVVDVAKRFYHLMERLELGAKGEDKWLNLQFEEDEEMKKEIQDHSVVREVCICACVSAVGRVITDTVTDTHS